MDVTEAEIVPKIITKGLKKASVQPQGLTPLISWAVRIGTGLGKLTET